VGNGFPALFGGKPMASLLAARRQHLAATLGLHANAETVRLGASASARLKCALWQNNPPLLPAIVIRDRSAVSITRKSRAAHWILQRLVPNLVVYSTLARRVKKQGLVVGQFPVSANQDLEQLRSYFPLVAESCLELMPVLDASVPM